MVRFLLLMTFTTLAVAVDGGANDPCTKLSRAGSFSLGIDIFAGTMISGDRAFAEVLRRSDRLSCFTKVIGMGTTNGSYFLARIT